MSEMDGRLPAPRNAGRLAQRRAAVVETLKDEFTEGFLQLDEFEERVAAAERAESADELDILVSDLRQREPVGAFAPAAEVERVACRMSTKKLSGTFLAARKLEIEAEMSTIKLDYREAAPPRGVINIVVDLNMSNLILYLPDGVVVENRVQEEMSTFGENKNAYDHPDAATTLIRITGTSRMSTIRAKRKRYWFFSRKPIKES
jgi:hypothetical protein